MGEAKRFLRLPTVIGLVGIGRTTIYQRIKDGTFPQPVQLGPRCVAWEESAIAKWQEGLKIGVKKDLV